DDAGDGEPAIREQVTEEWVEIEDIDEQEQQFAVSSSLQAAEELGNDDTHDVEAVDAADTEASGNYELPSDGIEVEESQDTGEYDRPGPGPGDAADFDLLPARRSAPTARIWKMLAAPLAL